MLNARHKLYIAENFNQMFLPGHNNTREPIWVYNKLDAVFHQHLLSQKVFDVKCDCRYYVEKLVTKTREDALNLKNLNEITKNAVIAEIESKRTRKRGRRQLEEEEIEYNEIKKPSGYSAELWEKLVDMEQFYTIWQSTIKPIENRDIALDNSNNNTDNKENISPDVEMKSAEPKLTKKAMEEAKKDAVDSFRATLRTDAIKLMNQRKEHIEKTSLFMDRSLLLLQKLEEQFTHREIEYKKKNDLIDKTSLLLDKLLQNS
jgi:hypothetical protein